MTMRIALAGNPNCGKTTLFNALTGSNQFVGNWPGVTVEKKEGKLKGYEDVIVTDLPGIYSLSPYTPEEIVARKYLVHENPDVILNIVDGTNLERNLYLTTQLTELGIPVVLAVNMIDLVRKKNDFIQLNSLSEKLGIPVMEISALKGMGIEEAAAAVVQAASKKSSVRYSLFSSAVEKAVKAMEALLKDIPSDRKRWYAIKLLERDSVIQEELGLSVSLKEQAEKICAALEEEEDDDTESILSNERYDVIRKTLSGCYKRSTEVGLSVSDRIDRIVTNRWLGLPVFAIIMFLVYWIAMAGIGATATDFVNDNIFGEGFHLFGNTEYTEDCDAFADAEVIVAGYEAYIEEFGTEPSGTYSYAVTDEETLETVYETATLEEYAEAREVYDRFGEEGPDAASYARYVPSIPNLIEAGLDALHTVDWLKGLILDGIVAGVGAVLGFVPQMLVLFFLLAFLEGCGYMARIAFVLDRVFRKFGLSGKSFIPMLVGTGCGVPGIMASRTIESEKDRRMTILTTTFIPCSAKIPFISMIAGAIFNGSAWVATSAYFIGMAAIILSGIILKKTRAFAGDPAPFVMELPAYHMPTVRNLLRSMWERGYSFIKKAGTIILLSTIVIWFLSYFGFTSEGFRMLEEEELQYSLLARIGNAVAWIFIPLGWGNWQATVASITGLVAKENIVGTMGILYSGQGDVYSALSQAFSVSAGYSFLVFNLLCAPCFAAIGAIKREMNNAKWTWFAILYQCGFAYVVAFLIYRFSLVWNGAPVGVGTLAAVLVACILVYLVVRKNKYEKKEVFA